MSVLKRLARGPGSIDKLLVHPTREFLLALDADPSAVTESPVHQGAALMRNWSEAVVGGDQANADAFQRSMENAAPSQGQPGLKPAEEAWHQHKVDHFSGKTVFLTHRQFVWLMIRSTATTVITRWQRA